MFAKKLVTPDLQNHGTTSLDAVNAKIEIFGFLAVKIILAQLNAEIIVTNRDGIVRVYNRDMLAQGNQRKQTLLCLSTQSMPL